MMRLAIIPARGGSKRIPRKNIREFAGRPVISWSIQAANKCGLFDKVVVSTDDEEIADISRQAGALTPFIRPVDLSGDLVPTRQVINHAINACEAVWGRFDEVCCIYATAPLLQVEDLRAAQKILTCSQSNFVFSAVAFDFPIQRAFRLNQLGEPEMFQPEHRFSRSQDLEAAFHDAAQFYWGRRDAFIAELHMFSSEAKPFLLPSHRVRDLDTEEDWRVALAMWHAQNDAQRTLT